MNSSKRIVVISLMLPAFATLLCGQQYKLEYDKQSPRGLLLEDASRIQDDAEEAQALETFLKLFPKDKSVPWVYDQLRQIADRANKPDRVIAFSEKLLECDPDDLFSAYTVFRIVEGREDQALIENWSGRVYQLSRKILAADAQRPAATAEEKQRLEMARNAATRIDALEFDKILGEKDAKVKLEKLDAYLKRNPYAEYRKRADPHYFFLYRTLGNGPKSYETAERLLQADPRNEDALIYIADSLFSRRSNTERVMAYSEQVLEILQTKEKPAWYSEADWMRKKGAYQGSALWMTGHLRMEQGDFAKAETLFRQALPYYKGDAKSTGFALFYLGWVEYNLGKLPEAAKVYEQCAALAGGFQAQAERNLAIVRGQQKAQLIAPDLTAAAPAMLGRGLIAMGAGSTVQKFFD